MIADLKPYPAMKDSGVTWLGKVPTHWDVMRTKWVLSRNDSGVWGNDFDDNGVIVLRSTEQTISGEWNILAPAKRRLSEFERLISRLEEGDLLVTTSSGSSLHIGKTTIVTRDVATLDCCFSNFMQRLRVKQNALPRFVWYLLNGEVGRRQLDYLSDTTTGLANLSGKIIGRVVLTFPSVPEQAAIVRFLDYAERRIRRYIRAKEKLIALLEEQKQAIIHQAVTGRIDVRTGQPYPAYKPSGVEWLDDVPAHWEVRRLKSLVRRIDQGVSPQAENRLAESTSWGVLKAGCVNGGVFRETEHKRLAPHFAFDRKLAVRVGDVLVSRANGSPRLVGSVGRISSLRHKLILSDKTFRLTFGQEVEPDFMVLAMNCRYYRQQVEQAISGAEGLANNLPLSLLRSFNIVVPRQDEQNAIIKYLQKYTLKLSAEIARTERKTALIGELRTAIITDVVTGKLDVRQAAAALPEVDPLADDDEADDPAEAVEEPAFGDDQGLAEVVG